MSEQRAPEIQPFYYNLDSVFQAKLDFSLQGVINAVAVMLIMGHEPSVPRLENVLRNIFKDPGAKRDRTSDLTCSRCGQKFEAKAKHHDRFFYIGPDLLEKYAAEESVIVFSFPSRILAVKAKELYLRRQLASPGKNRDGEPYLDFSGVKIPAILEIRRRKKCSWDPSKINWENVVGSSGPYERSEDVDNPDFKAMLRDLQGHKGKLNRDDYFYWAFENRAIVGRKRLKQKSS